ncbi:7TM diverse intracellular signaling domain-containing protein [Pedobacter nyackensis]|uniref:sensor histidine kinase n=1 Tax=Pedobacter nyackensis TaxID=475255 RepID=UPI002930B80E|nr:7TM diverse intracellular signaling domain-containing protein [Pedobacter nyackensis]
MKNKSIICFTVGVTGNLHIYRYYYPFSIALCYLYLNMFLRCIFCIFLWLTATGNVVAKDIILTNSEAFYKIKDVRLSKDAVWLDIRLKNNSASNDWYIQVPPPVNEVDLYTERKDGGFNHIKLNDKTLYPNRPVKVNGFILPLSLSKGENRHYYLRIKNNYKLKVPIYAGTLEAIYEEEHFKNIINGFMFGALLALMIYNLYIYIAIKDRSYIYYLGYIFFSIVFLMIWNGYFTHWLPTWSLRILTGSSAAVLIFSILFTNGYLRTAHYAPILFNFRKWLIMAFLVPVAIDLAGFYVFAFQLLQASLCIAIAYWLAAGYFSLKKGFKPAAYYLVALGFLLMSYLFYEGFHSSMSLQMGLCLQALTLSFALAVDLNNLKKETMHLQKAMIAQTAGFSKDLIIGQDNEKENIANELNSCIGQQLVLLKNEMFVLEKRAHGTQQALFNSITKDIGKAIEEVSNVSFSLRPYQMDALGLKCSVERLAKDIETDTETAIHLDIDETGQILDKVTEMNIYRMIQELLNNLIKHASAKHCWINIKNGKDYLTFFYRDNGKGFDPSTISSGLGLSGIRERCTVINASISLASKHGSGTKINIKIPHKITTASL